jgi:hypothetical protein
MKKDVKKNVPTPVVYKLAVYTGFYDESQNGLAQRREDRILFFGSLIDKDFRIELETIH